MWISKDKYEAMQRLIQSNERDANLIRSIAFSLETQSLLMNEKMVVMTREHYDTLIHEKNSLSDAVLGLTAERDWYKQKCAEFSTR